VQNALGSGGHLVVSSKEIFSIAGRDWGLGCKHASAIFIMWTTPSAAPYLTWFGKSPTSTGESPRFLAKPPKLSIFSYDICFDFRLNHEQNKKN